MRSKIKTYCRLYLPPVLTALFVASGINGCVAPEIIPDNAQSSGKNTQIKPLTGTSFKKIPDAEWRTVKASEGALRSFRNGFEKSRSNPEEAVKSYMLALSKEPNFIEARYNLGLLFLKLGDPKGAKEEFLKAVESGSKMPELYNALGIAYAETGQLKAAENALTFAASTDKRVHTLTNLSVVYYLEGKEAIASETLEKALGILRDDPYANYNAGIELLKKNDLKGAAAKFKKSLALLEKTPLPGLAYAETVFNLGDYAASIKTYEEVAKLHPKNSHARLNLGIIYELYLNDYAKAAEHYKAYIGLNGPRAKEASAWLDLLKEKSKQ